MDWERQQTSSICKFTDFFGFLTHIFLFCADFFGAISFLPLTSLYKASIRPKIIVRISAWLSAYNIYLTFINWNLFLKNLRNADLCTNFALAIPRDGAVVARWAHNPKVRGSSPLPATKRAMWLSHIALALYISLQSEYRLGGESDRFHSWIIFAWMTPWFKHPRESGHTLGGFNHSRSNCSFMDFSWENLGMRNDRSKPDADTLPLIRHRVIIRHRVTALTQSPDVWLW